MELATKLLELEKRTQQHREVLLTEEAAKTALVMPFIQALGYDVFNPSEVVPEFTADVGLKKGEKVDYAICRNGAISMLIECKPASSELSVTHAAQLFRYFSVTDARVAVLTNGVVYQFYSDIDQPNKMDERPFYTFTLDGMRKTDPAILDRFTKSGFDIDKIVEEAGNLKIQSLLREELKKEFAQPSEDLVRLLSGKVYTGKFTAAIKEKFQVHVAAAIASLVRELVSERLTSALNVADPTPTTAASIGEAAIGEERIATTDDELAGWRIVQAICSKRVSPKRIIIRDQKSYCGILLDDNNRRSVARLYFNSPTTRYVSTFVGKEEERHLITDLTDIYKLSDAILLRLGEFEKHPDMVDQKLT